MGTLLYDLWLHYDATHSVKTYVKEIFMNKSTCFRNNRQIRSRAFLWHRKQIFGLFGPPCIWMISSEFGTRFSPYRSAFRLKELRQSVNLTVSSHPTSTWCPTGLHYPPHGESRYRPIRPSSLGSFAQSPSHYWFRGVDKCVCSCSWWHCPLVIGQSTRYQIERLPARWCVPWLRVSRAHLLKERRRKRTFWHVSVLENKNVSLKLGYCPPFLFRENGHIRHFAYLTQL